MRLKAGVVSDCGNVRSANEDSFILRPGLYVVCDGMGGARAGEVASQMACLGLLNVDPTSAGIEELRQAIVKANMAIIERSTSESELLGMGTTLTAALLTDDTLFIAHVGDSRAYMLHEGKLTQATADHSWVGEMVRRGELTPEQAARHPHRSVITKALGTDIILEPDLLESPVVPGDRVLICSDGLTGMIDDETIAHIMSMGRDAQQTAQALVDAALENGGEDNVTVVIVDVRSSDEEDDATEEGPWSDSRILIGPSDRQSTVHTASHGVERLSLAARERLRRLGAAAAHHQAAEDPDRSASERSEADGIAHESGQKDSDGAKKDKTSGKKKGKSEATESDDSKPATVPPPGRKRHKKKSAEGGREKRRGRRRWLVVVTVVLLVLVIAVGGFAWYNSTVYYLGEEDGKVALYRGLPWEFLGVEFSSVYRLAPVDYPALSPYVREQVDSHELLSKEEGQQFLDGLSTGL